VATLPRDASSVNASTTVKGRDMVAKIKFAESPRPEKTNLTPWSAEKTLVIGKSFSSSVNQRRSQTHETFTIDCFVEVMLVKVDLQIFRCSRNVNSFHPSASCVQ
jgi:hypothetical protein